MVFGKPADQLKRSLEKAAKLLPDYNRAIDELRGAIAKHAQLAAKDGATAPVIEAYQKLAELCAKANQPGDAVRALEDLRRHSFGVAPAAEAGLKLITDETAAGRLSERDLLTLADWLASAGQLSQAAPALGNALEERFPRSLPLMARLGDALMAQRDYRGAARCYRNIIVERTADGSQFIPNLQTILEAEPDNQTAHEALGQVLFRRGDVQQGDFEHAAQHLAAALQLGDLDAGSLFQLADALLKLRRWDDVVDTFERLLGQPDVEVELLRRCEDLIVRNIDPTAPAYRRTQRVVGDVFRRQSRYDEALERYRVALNGLPIDDESHAFANSLIVRLNEVAISIKPVYLARTHLELGRAHTLAGAPTQALESYRESVKANVSVRPDAIAGMRIAVAIDPSLTAARLQLAKWQVEERDVPGAFDTLEAVRRESPSESGATMDLYRRLMAVLETTAAYPAVLSGTLHALAEGTAVTAPAEAVSFLSQVADRFGADQADRVLSQLQALDLLDRQPLIAHLVEGDAYRAKGDFDSALSAYQRTPLNAQTIDAICGRLEQLSEVNARRADALLDAAAIRLDAGMDESGVSLLRRAFERDRDKTSSIVTTRLGPLRDTGQCPAEGLVLLIDALIFRGDKQSLAAAVEATRDLFDKGPSYTADVVARCQRLRDTADRKSKTIGQATLLLGEALALSGQHTDAANIYREAVGYPQVDEEHLLAVTERLAQEAPNVASVWLALGNAHQRKKMPDVDRILTAYRRAIEIDPSQSAGPVLDRLETLPVTPEIAVHVHLLQAAVLVKSERTSEAIDELRKTLPHGDDTDLEEADRLCGELPDVSATWLLRADLDSARARPESAVAWLDRVVEAGAQGDVQNAHTLLVGLSERFHDYAAPHFGLARAYARLGQMEQAAAELGHAALAFPAARQMAIDLLHRLSQTTAISAVWLALARAYIADGNVPSSLSALRRALEDEAARTQVYESLQSLLSAQPRHVDVLQAIVEVEILLRSDAALEHAVDHVEVWLASADGQTTPLNEVMPRLISALENLDLDRSPIMLRARLVWADALFAAHQPATAVDPLRAILTRWPDETNQVIERSARSLAQQETLEVRLLLIDAHMAREDYEQALDLCRDAPYTEASACQAFAERCRRLMAATQSGEPPLASRAAMNLAEWLARQADAVGTADACRAAARLDPEQGRSIAGWLESRGWDEQSHRTLLHAVADIWREHSRSTLEQALNTYRLVLNFNFEAEAPYVLQALEHFPRDYVPAWQFKLDIYVQLGPTFYSNAFATMRDALSVFDAQQTEWLLTVCDRMDASIPDVHLVRAEIHEAAEQLPLAAEALLGLQAVRPDVLPLVERSFADIIQRHPDEHYLRASLGDAYRNAEKWDAALEEYQQAQHADDELAAQLVDRYRDILSRVPESIEARWSLARAHRTLKQPEQASQYLDEITDRNGAQSAEAEPFLKALTKSHPTCGYVWYVRGKLAFRAGDLSVAIAHLKRAVKEGHIPQAPLILLHEMLGRAYQATDALDQAVMNLRRAVALSPDDPALRRALLGVRLTQIDRLIAEKEREIETSKDKVRVQIELADLLQQRGDYPRAVRVLQSALTQTDQRCRIHLALARCFARQGLHHLAAASLEAAASGDELTDEERKETLYRLAQTRWRQLRYEEAIQALEQICALDVTYQNVLGLIDMIQRDKVTAQHQAVTLRIASRVNPFAEGR